MREANEKGSEASVKSGEVKRRTCQLVQEGQRSTHDGGVRITESTLHLMRGEKGKIRIEEDMSDTLTRQMTQ